MVTRAGVIAAQAEDTSSVRAGQMQHGDVSNSLAPAAAALSLFGNYHSMGVIVAIDANDDPDEDATATLTYREGAGGGYRQGFPLTRISATRFAGSIFWLKPAEQVVVRVSLADPDNGPLNGTVLDASGVTRPELSLPAPLHTFVASPDGSGMVCSLAAPCALEQALGMAHAGDAVVLRGGVYYRGEMDMPCSGGAGAPIVIRSYTGEKAILDGGDPATFSWQDQGGGIYRTNVHAPDTHLVTADGQRLYPYQSLSDLQNLVWGIPGFYANGKVLYVHLAGDKNPSSAAIVVSRFNYAFAIEQDAIYFDHLVFRHYGRGNWAKALYFNNANDNLVQHCTFELNDLGIGFKRNSNRNLIQHNTFRDTDFQWDWHAVKGGSRLETGGVRFYSPMTGRGNVIRRNSFHDYFDGLGICPETAGSETSETDFYENLVYNAGDDGVETDGTCSNVRIWSNTFHDVLMGISLAPVYKGPVFVIRNLIYHTGAGNNTFSGSPFKFNSGYGKSGVMYLFHNTSDAALPGNNGIYIKAPGSWKNIVSRNNIWAGTNYALNDYNETQPINFDYDDLYTSNPDEYVYWGSGPDRHMRSLNVFRTKTGQEQHGTDAKPGFVDAASADYTLGESSSLIDAGVVLPGINDAFNGSAPDIGAFEYEGSGFALDVLPPVMQIAPGETAVFTVSVRAVGGFTGTVSLSVPITMAGLDVYLTPLQVNPGNTARLTMTDTHTVLTSPGVWYAVPVDGKSNGDIRTAIARLLVGGAMQYLPVIFRGYLP